jgi:hypothetical protein
MLMKSLAPVGALTLTTADTSAALIHSKDCHLCQPVQRSCDAGFGASS